MSRQILQKLIPLAEKVARHLGRPAVLMEVCGTHTMAISRSEVETGKGNVYLKTVLGGARKLDTLAGAPLPRIC